MSRRPVLPFACLLAAVALAPAGGGRAQTNQTKLDVQLGWGERVRGGRWTPILITASDASPRNVYIDLYAPHDGVNSMRIRQHLTLNPQPATVALYAPLVNFTAEEVSVLVRDAGTGRVLAHWPPETADGPPVFLNRYFIPGNVYLIGVTGRGATMRLLENQLDNTEEGRTQFTTGYLEPGLLPFTPAGYDSLDLLVLNAPDLARLDNERQQAAADWVRAGGNLLMWPGEAPLPDASPLLDILPAKIGAQTQYTFGAGQLDRLGLQRRFGRVAGRVLEPALEAETVPLFGADGPHAYRKRVGLGQVFVAPLDIAQLQFTSTAQARAFWDPVLRPMLPAATGQGVYANQHQWDQREFAATEALANELGNVPGAGRFNFWYVSVVLIGMMLVVGPIDWFVLKRLGRQPWTWVTTGGWIALLTTGALFIGHVLRSGDLHYRTIRLVEQADGAAAATTDFVCVYAPKTADYALASSPDVWWEPISPGGYGYRREVITDWRFHQTYRGNQPLPMRINVWNLRFLRGKAVGAGDPLIAADLSLRPGGDGISYTLVGTVTNRGAVPLRHLLVQTRNGAYQLDADAALAEGAKVIAPGATLTVNALLNPVGLRASHVSSDGQIMGQYGPAQSMRPDELLLAASDLAGRGALRAQQLVQDRDDVAVVYALGEPAESPVKLKGQQPVPKHWLAVRALVALKPAGGGGPAPATQPAAATQPAGPAGAIGK